MKGEVGECAYSIHGIQPGLCANAQTTDVIWERLKVERRLSLDLGRSDDLLLRSQGGAPIRGITLKPSAGLQRFTTDRLPSPRIF
jgi:hypothetical protein